MAHVQVTMSDSFQKLHRVVKPILENLNSTIDGYVKAKVPKETHRLPYLLKKINESLLKTEQFQGQISAAKTVRLDLHFWCLNSRRLPSSGG